MFAVTFQECRSHQYHETPFRILKLFLGDAELRDRKIHVSGDALLTVGGFPPDRVSPSRVTQLLGAVDPCDVAEAGDAGCNDFEDGSAGGGPRIVTPPHEPFLRNRETSLCEESTLFRREGGGGSSVSLHVLRRELGLESIDAVEGSQTSELNERNLASR